MVGKPDAKTSLGRNRVWNHGLYSTDPGIVPTVDIMYRVMNLHML